MEAKEYLDEARDSGEIVDVICYGEAKPIGRGKALVVEFDDAELSGIGVMLGDCGSPERTKVKAGAIVKITRHPESTETRIVGTPAYAVPTVIGGTRMP